MWLRTYLLHVILIPYWVVSNFHKAVWWCSSILSVSHKHGNIDINILQETIGGSRFCSPWLFFQKTLQLLPLGPSTPVELEVFYLVNSGKDEYRRPAVWLSSSFWDWGRTKINVSASRPFFLFELLDLLIRVSKLLPKGKHSSCLYHSACAHKQGFLHDLHTSITQDCSYNVIYSLVGFSHFV